jgi:hypothetical protein
VPVVINARNAIDGVTINFEHGQRSTVHLFGYSDSGTPGERSEARKLNALATQICGVMDDRQAHKLVSYILRKKPLNMDFQQLMNTAGVVPSVMGHFKKEFKAGGVDLGFPSKRKLRDALARADQFCESGDYYADGEKNVWFWRVRDVAGCMRRVLEKYYNTHGIGYTEDKPRPIVVLSLDSGGTGDDKKGGKCSKLSVTCTFVKNANTVEHTVILGMMVAPEDYGNLRGVYGCVINDLEEWAAQPVTLRKINTMFKADVEEPMVSPKPAQSAEEKKEEVITAKAVREALLGAGMPLVKLPFNAEIAINYGLVGKYTEQGIERYHNVTNKFVEGVYRQMKKRLVLDILFRRFLSAFLGPEE